MREIYVSPDYTRVGFYKSILDQAGIPGFIRNAAGNGLTEIPVPLFYPALCVLHDGDYDRAMELVKEVHFARRTRLPEWICPACQAKVPGNFEICWQCGQESVPDE